MPSLFAAEVFGVDSYRPASQDLDRAAANGINALQFSAGYWADEEGGLNTIPGLKDLVISFIDEAHAKGFKVWLVPELVYPTNKSHQTRIPDEILENTDFMQEFDSAVIEWAGIAEEHGVEIFSPLGEAYVKFGRERSKTWLAEIKPEIEAVYSGKICARGEWPIPELSSYSCFGPTVDIPENEQEKQNLINQIENARGQATELILGEIWEGGNWQGTPEDAKRGFRMAFEAGEGRVSGFFVLDVPSLPGADSSLSFDDYESVVREFYTQS